nr:hypothetical protein [Dehalococcoidales bacterium]
ELRNMKRLYALWMRDRVFVGPFADLANIPPVGEGRWVWYNEPRKHLPGRGSWNVVARHAAKAVYRRSMPRRVRIARTKQNELRYATPPLRFNEWFATTDAESRHLTVSDLMAPPGGILSASAPAIAERLALMADQRLCLAPPLGLLAAAYLADFNRRIGEQR